MSGWTVHVWARCCFETAKTAACLTRSDGQIDLHLFDLPTVQQNLSPRNSV